jgi:multicomponent Na+:H+ antiporter subunit D
MKMALFPLHGWLPNAYAYAPSSAAGVIAPLTTKVMVYVLIRMLLFVFKPEYAFARPSLNQVMLALAVIAIISGSVMALSQKSLKKILVYIIVAEVGYMVGGVWLGNRLGIAGSILHIVNDAAMTLCVFLAAGSLRFKLRGDNFRALQGTFRRMPITMSALVVGGLSIIGAPPTCGFFSKWYLISGGIDAGQYHFVAALLFSSLVNVVLFFKIIEIGYFEPFIEYDSHHGHGPVRINEAPLSMLAMLLLVAASLIALGLFSGKMMTHIIMPAIPAGIV